MLSSKPGPVPGLLFEGMGGAHSRILGLPLEEPVAHAGDFQSPIPYSCAPGYVLYFQRFSDFLIVELRRGLFVLSRFVPVLAEIYCVFLGNFLHRSPGHV
jgi:hypothetical protein